MRSRVLIACEPPLLADAIGDVLRLHPDVTLVDDESASIVIATPPAANWGATARAAAAWGARVVIVQPGGWVRDLIALAVAG